MNLSGESGWRSHPFDDDKLREECGVFGIYGIDDAANYVALGLHALQHRGQEAAGIVTSDGELRSVGHDEVSVDTALGGSGIVNVTGAYGAVMASNYNRRPLPAEVLVTVMRFHQKYFSVETADGKLAPGETWIQESIVGTRFSASFRWHDQAKGSIIPTVTGNAYVNAQGMLLFDERDPFCWGIRM